MKNSPLFILLFFLLVCCKSKHLDNSSKILPHDILFRSINAKILKIDSVDNYYLVYASDINDKNKYKIVSKKKQNTTCKKKIILDSFYSFKVKALLPETPPQGVDVPMNYLDLKRCTRLEGNTEVCTESGIINIYETNSLLGLCHLE